MNSLFRHVSRAFIAGIVALLPVGGVVLTVVYLESVIANSWLRDQAFYFPGLGLLLAAAIIYAIGITVSTFVGRWLWGRFDRLLDDLPALGQFYRSLKQILGYGEGKDAMFERVVLVPGRDSAGLEIGLVTNRGTDTDGQERIIAFVPGAPNPTTGRLVILPPEQVRPLDIPVNEALKALVSVGKTPLLPSGEQRDV